MVQDLLLRKRQQCRDLVWLIVIIVIVQEYTLGECSASSFSFLVEHGAEDINVFAPIGTTVILNCTARSISLSWVVHVNGTGPFIVISGLELSHLGIAGETSDLDGGVKSSLLRVNASEMNNETEVVCQFTPPAASPLNSNRITIVVFDIPSPPSDVVVTDISEHTVNVSWSSETISGVDVQFNLTVVNLNTSEELIFEPNNTNYIFTPSPPKFEPCDVYRFQVTAINGAGSSEPSEAVVSMLPSLPDISPVSESLGHVVEKKDGEISLTITSMFAGSCRDYKVTNYAVVLRLQEEIMTFPIILDPTGERLEVTLGPSDGLRENTQYTYHITAENRIDVVTSSPENLYTSDLRGIGAKEGENNSLIIECLFINGSDALGCLILLISSDNQARNISRRFYRNNFELVLEGVLNVNEDLSCYHSVLGFDVEADNSTSELSLPGELNITTSSKCSPQDDVEKDEGSTNAIIIAVPVAVFTLLVLITGATMVVCIIIIIQYQKVNEGIKVIRHSTTIIA